MTKRQIENRAKKIEKLEQAKKELEKQINEIKEEIKNEMQDNEIIEAGNYIIKWTKYTKQQFDSKTFKAKHTDLFNAYLNTSEMRRFTVSAS